MKLSEKIAKKAEALEARRQKMMKLKEEAEKVEDELPINSDTAEVIFENDDIQVIVAESPITEDGDNDGTIKVIVATNKEDKVEDEEVLVAYEADPESDKEEEKPEEKEEVEVKVDTKEETKEACDKNSCEKKCESKKSGTRIKLISK